MKLGGADTARMYYFARRLSGPIGPKLRRLNLFPSVQLYREGMQTHLAQLGAEGGSSMHTANAEELKAKHHDGDLRTCLWEITWDDAWAECRETTKYLWKAKTRR